MFYFQLSAWYTCIAIINIISTDEFSSEVEDLPHKICSYIVFFYIIYIGQLLHMFLIKEYAFISYC